MMQIRLNGVVFDGGAGDVGFSIATMTGWDGIEYRSDMTDRPAAFGSFDAPAYGAARVVSWQGRCFARSESDFLYKRAALTGMLGDGSSGRMVVDENAVTLWCDVRLASRSKFESVVWGRIADYQVSVVAVDPRKYGDLRTFQGSTVQAYQYGNFPATPVIEVTGSMPGYMVASQGMQFVVNQSLASGQTHRIDLARGWLYRNDVLQSGAVDVAESFTVPPGRQVSVVLTPLSGSGQMTVKVTDTFI